MSMRTSLPEIQESVEVLAAYLDRETSKRRRQRLQVLYFLRSGTLGTREKVAEELNVHRHTVSRWLSTYAEEGLEAMLAIKTRPNRKPVLTPSVRQALDDKLASEHDFQSYRDIQAWLQERFRINVNYKTLYRIVSYELQRPLHPPQAVTSDLQACPSTAPEGDGRAEGLIPESSSRIPQPAGSVAEENARINRAHRKPVLVSQERGEDQKRGESEGAAQKPGGSRARVGAVLVEPTSIGERVSRYWQRLMGKAPGTQPTWPSPSHEIPASVPRPDPEPEAVEEEQITRRLRSTLQGAPDRPAHATAVSQSPLRAVRAAGSSAPHVLLIEDDELTASLIQHRIQREGWAVEQCIDGEEVRAFMNRSEPIDLILLSSKIPGASGFELLQQFRTLTPYARVPILMLAWRGNDQEITRAFEKGVDDYVLKPFSPVELMARIQRFRPEQAESEALGFTKHMVPGCN